MLEWGLFPTPTFIKLKGIFIMDYNKITLDDLNSMSLDKLKDVAKFYNIKIGNIGEEKLRDKLKTVIEENVNTGAISEGFDDDIVADEEPVEIEKSKKGAKSIGDNLKSITESIDELDESSADDDFEVVDLPKDTIIPVKSMTFGRLNYFTRAGAPYWWQNIGDVTNMTVGAIEEMNNYNRDYLHKPMVILMDERAVKYFRLKEVYENVAKVNNLKTLFKQNMETINKTIDAALAVNMRDILIAKVRTMYKNGSLKDIKIIRLLERKLQYDLSDEIAED